MPSQPDTMPTISFDAITPAATVPYAIWSGVYYLNHIELVKLFAGKTNNKSALAAWDKLHASNREDVLRQSLGYKFPSTYSQSKLDLTFLGALKLSMYLSGPNEAAHARAVHDIMKKYSLGPASLGQVGAEPGTSMDKPVAGPVEPGWQTIQQSFAKARPEPVCDGSSRADPVAPAVVREPQVEAGSGAPAPEPSPDSLEFIPFDELHPGAMARQALMGEDDAQFLSVRDVVMCLYGKVWGDARGEKAASNKWNNLSALDKQQLGEDLKIFRFSGSKIGSPVIAFSAVPLFCTLVLKEKAPASMPGVIRVMQKYFVGEPAQIPAVVDVSAGDETSIPFDEIVAGASARATVINGEIHAYTREVIQYLTGSSPKRSSEIWRTLPEDQVEELQPFVKEYQFSGERQHTVPVISFPGILKLVMFLRGAKAFEHRSAIVKIMQRYHAGDKALIPEIQANAVSDAPVAQLARASLANESESGMQVEDQQTKKRQLEHAAAMFDLEVSERKQKFDMTVFEAYERKQRLELETAERKHKMELQTAEHKHRMDMETAEHQKKMELDTVERQQKIVQHKKTFVLDTQEREMGMQLKFIETCTSTFKNGLLKLEPQAAIMPPSPAPSGEKQDNGSTIGEMLEAMGYSFDPAETRQIGFRVFNDYKKTRGVPPIQRQVDLEDSRRLVNIYSDGDCTLIDETVAKFMIGKLGNP